MSAEKNSQAIVEDGKIKANEFDIVPVNKLTAVVSSVVVVTLAAAFAMWQLLATAESKLYVKKVVEKKTSVLLTSDGTPVNVTAYIKKQRELLEKGGELPETKEKVIPIDQAIDKLVKNPHLIENIK